MVVVSGLDMRGELIRFGERPRTLSVEASVRATDESFRSITAVYRSVVPYQFVSTLEWSSVLATIDIALKESM